MVVFGASGDLSARKLMPALARLAARGELSDAFTLVGVARTPLSDDEFRSFCSPGRRRPRRLGDASTKQVGTRRRERFRYVAGSYDSDETFDAPRRLSSTSSTSAGAPTATACTTSPYPRRCSRPSSPPSAVTVSTGHRLAMTAPSCESSSRSPSGTTCAAREQLDELVHRDFDESQVYRIDHYLGKESVQNVLALRFANTIFEPIWNRRYVDAVEITVAEDGGVGHRGELLRADRRVAGHRAEPRHADPRPHADGAPATMDRTRSATRR